MLVEVVTAFATNSLALLSDAAHMATDALALGIARGAIDGFAELMATKVDRFTGTALRERLTVQERMATAEAAVRAARAFLYEMGDEVWGTVVGGMPLTERQLALFRLANMHAVAAGAQAVDLVKRPFQKSG